MDREYCISLKSSRGYLLIIISECANMRVQFKGGYNYFRTRMHTVLLADLAQTNKKSAPDRDKST